MELKTKFGERSFGLKLLLVCGLALVMAVPALFVFTVVYDRQHRANEAVAEVSVLHGGAQTLLGPVLVIPYERDVLEDGKVRRVRGLFYLYPETGTARTDLTSKTLKRGMHDVPVYRAETVFTARFNPAAAARESGALDLFWPQARFVMTASDMRGAAEPAVLKTGGRSVFFEPGLPGMEAAPAENGPRPVAVNKAGAYSPNLMSAAPPMRLSANSEPFEATAETVFSGAQSFAIAPFAQNTRANMRSDWRHPSFGAENGFLPTRRNVTEKGFTAEWNVPALARGTPAAGTGLSAALDSVTARAMPVRFIQPASPYQSVQRALKYALMFTGFVFLAYFLFEVLSGRRAHAAQYVLVGLAQAIFYLLLLALAEHIGFDLAFLIAAAAVIIQLGLYAGAVFGARRYAVRALGVFTVLYGLMYVLMRMEDFALLTGALASFAAVAAVMWITRDIDWYGEARAAAPAP